MKLHYYYRQLAIASMFTLTSGLLLVQQASASGRPVKKISITAPAEEEPAKKNKIKAKSSFASLNNSAVKIYPDAVKRDMHVVAKENDGKEIDFFVFDLQGTLVQNYKMKAKDHYRLTGLSRGTYVYRVFSGDEETATGRFEIR